MIIQKHPQDAYDMLKHIDYLQAALEIPYCHHEKWDGTGYPRGLKGEEIPSRHDCLPLWMCMMRLINDRPYRKALPREEVIALPEEPERNSFRSAGRGCLCFAVKFGPIRNMNKNSVGLSPNVQQTASTILAACSGLRPPSYFFHLFISLATPQLKYI